MSSLLTLNNFEQNDAFKNSFGGKLNGILDVSPSGADATSNITKTKSGYLGILEIISSQGKFAVETTSENLDQMVRALFRLMHQQLDNWRKLRFL